ncbi:hypothetical protein CIHG_06999 [Coccidioides immitis H538.4]|uniref:Uncharacterized protein n=3 Tax=Coccidioides immitis TaxID=5501 RepID=A0A0J8QYN0_COCIT|nr:hypothetical protein CIRG_10043 [Coccidioides immitis RMSCC 2394]KMU77135.1 hypothetical protein CISG_06173 [Coccidioides immitis RMSCC 3703]KMU89326.1 hypothetical protein CIHG_06999 [Coccidioides immitis H538.4]
MCRQKRRCGWIGHRLKGDSLLLRRSKKRNITPEAQPLRKEVSTLKRRPDAQGRFNVRPPQTPSPAKRPTIGQLSGSCCLREEPYDIMPGTALYRAACHPCSNVVEAQEKDGEKLP